jgi:DNA-binding NarL/FixJ family response regulator
MTNNISIFLVDDHLLFRESLKFTLSKIQGLNIIGEASNGKEFLEILNTCTPDIVLMDISMPEMDGITATEHAVKKYPQLKIIAITSFGDEIYYKNMIKAGACGFIQKHTNLTELQQAIETVNSGMNYFPAHLLRNIVSSSEKRQNSNTTNDYHLSAREIEILKYICQGYSNNEIGTKLFISPKTVDNHRTSLLSKTGTRNSAHLVMFAIKQNLVEL